MIRMSTTAATVNRVNAVIVVLACCCAGSTSAWAIDCLSNPGDPKTGYYSWRDIDGRKCWFKKTGAIPAKSQLQWPAKSKQEARSVEPASPSNEQN